MKPLNNGNLILDTVIMVFTILFKELPLGRFSERLNEVKAVSEHKEGEALPCGSTARHP